MLSPYLRRFSPSCVSQHFPKFLSILLPTPKFPFSAFSPSLSPTFPSLSFLRLPAHPRRPDLPARGGVGLHQPPLLTTISIFVMAGRPPGAPGPGEGEIGL